MKSMVGRVRVGLFIILVAASSGCVSYKTNTVGRGVRQNAVKMIGAATTPVTLVNAVPQSGEQKIGGWIGWSVYGDLHKFTGTCIDSLKIELDRQRVQVAAQAPKTMSLQVFSAKAEQGMVKFRASASLKVRTGSGIEKQYTGWQNYMNGWATTAAVEGALMHCVEQMLSDEDILAYLRQ